MTLDLFPKYRHLVVVTAAGTRYPSRIHTETSMGFETQAGYFLKHSRAKFGDPATTFHGPFTAEGDMESRP